MHLEYTNQVNDIVESIFSSYFDYSIKHPDNLFNDWYKNKNARKKFKTLNLIVKQKGLCYHCEEVVEYKVSMHHPRKTSLDRIIPGSQGGGYKIDNIVLSCMFCNKQRGDKSIEEYQEWLHSA